MSSSESISSAHAERDRARTTDGFAAPWLRTPVAAALTAVAVGVAAIGGFTLGRVTDSGSGGNATVQQQGGFGGAGFPGRTFGTGPVGTGRAGRGSAGRGGSSGAPGSSTHH